MEWVHEAEKCRGSLRFLLQRFTFFMHSLLNLVAVAGKIVGKPSAFSRRKNARRSGAGFITPPDA